MGNGGKKFDGKCNLCGKHGHKEVDCWENEANASKRPAKWKSSLNNESANAQVNAAEVLLTSIESSIEKPAIEKAKGCTACSKHSHSAKTCSSLIVKSKTTENAVKKCNENAENAVKKSNEKSSVVS